jgi:pimeloyl-ACP methyl ester carboxylesterase
LAAVPGLSLIDFDLVPGRGGPARLFLHGFGGDKHQLRPLGDRLPPAGLAMYVSFRAHGGSSRPAWGYSVLDFTADVHRVADVLPTPIDVIGFSFGALVGAASALTWGGNRIRSLVVIDQSFAADPARHEADEWAEGSYLRWMYDYRPMLDRLDIPLLVVAAEESDMIGPAERWRVTRTVPGDHLGCLADPGALAAAIGTYPC